MLLLSAALGADLQPGDLVFHRSTSAQSEAIARATGSGLTHTGIVLEHAGRLEVLEAVEPVRWTPVDAWIARGEGFTARRLADRSALTPEALGRLGELGASMVGLHYDTAFSWSDDRMYCSELVYKLYQRAVGIEVGRLRALRDFDVTDPLVAAALRDRYGSRVPWGEPVVSPADVAADLDLVEVR